MPDSMRISEPTADYVRRLEAHLRLMAEGMDSLREQLTAAELRNRELEYGAQLASYNGDAEREALRRAEGIVAEAEARVGQILDQGRLRAREVESSARARAEQMIATVRAEIDGLEHEAAERLRAAELRAGRPGTPLDSPSPAPGPGSTPGRGSSPAHEGTGTEIELDSLRTQINELLQLRERILVGIRGALAGFGERLGELESMPLVDDAPPAAAPADGEEAGPPGDAAGVAAVELLAEPVASFAVAGEVEHGLAEIPGTSAVLLRSIEEGRATLDVRGLPAAQLAPAVAERFPDARCELLDGERLQLTLAPTTAVKRGEAAGEAATGEAGPERSEPQDRPEAGGE